MLSLSAHLPKTDVTFAFSRVVNPAFNSRKNPPPQNDPAKWAVKMLLKVDEQPGAIAPRGGG